MPKDPKASQILKTKVARYCLVNGQMYQRSFHGPLALYLSPAEANYVIREVLEEVCGNHFGADSLVLKLMRANYYFPQWSKILNLFISMLNVNVMLS